MVKNYSLSRSGLEIFKTENNKTQNLSDISPDIFNLQNGPTREIYYASDLLSTNFEQDYEEINSNGEVSVHKINENRVYKGVKICLKKAWESPNTSLKWEDLDSVLLGFISNQSYSTDDITLKICGMDKLLENQYKFNFTKTKRSVILKKIIETSGLKANINVKGLSDDVIDYTNVTSSSSSSDNNTSSASNDVVTFAKECCDGKTSEHDKAQAIHSGIRSRVKYPSPNYYDHKKSPSQVLSSGYSNCCDRARLGYQCAGAVGLTARGVHGPGHVWVQYKINGKWVNSDPGTSRPNLGKVWNGESMDRVWEFP